MISKLDERSLFAFIDFSISMAPWFDDPRRVKEEVQLSRIRNQESKSRKKVSQDSFSGVLPRRSRLATPRSVDRV